MATSRSSSAAARLSRAAAQASFRASGAGICSDFATCPRALITHNENKIWSPNSFSTSFVNRIASSSALALSYSTAAATGQIAGAKSTTKIEKAAWGSMVVKLPNRILWHMYEGMEEIMADYVHQEMTRTWILICFRLFLIIIMKDAFLALTHL